MRCPAECGLANLRTGTLRNPPFAAIAWASAGPHKFALISNAYVASVPREASDDGIEPALLPIELRIALTASLPIVRSSMSNSLDLDGRPQDTRVVVAMSGGVDSSVTAALLKADGYDVVGVTLQLYDHGAATHRKGACCAGQDIYDARGRRAHRNP